MTQMWKGAEGGSEPSPRPRKYSPRRPTTILVVEDNPDEAGLIEAVFATGLSYTDVDVAFSGEEAQEYLLQRDLPALITLDLFLPDTNGLDILEWMGHDDRFADIPVVIFTSSSDPSHAKRAYSLGARRYLVKPANFGGLVSAVREELGRWIDPELNATSA
jgi:two-component system response regulator